MAFDGIVAAHAGSGQPASFASKVKDIGGKNPPLPLSGGIFPPLSIPWIQDPRSRVLDPGARILKPS